MSHKTSKIESRGKYKASKYDWNKKFCCSRCNTHYTATIKDLRKYEFSIINNEFMDGEKIVVFCPLEECPSVECLGELFYGDDWQLSYGLNEDILQDIEKINLSDILYQIKVRNNF